jgi:hypothetical protein
MLEFFQTQSTDSHYNAIKTAHSDYDDLVDGIQEWIGTQPAGLRAAYSNIAEDGDTQDVISLVSLYKQANGIETKPKEEDAGKGLPATPKAPVVVRPAAAPQITQEAKQAAAKLRVVATERAAPPAAGAETFDDAFKQAVAEG